MNKIVVLSSIAFLIVIYIFVTFFRGGKINSKQSRANMLQTIDSSDIPSSNTADCAYSMWIYIQDWNYRRTEEKKIIVRDDSGNTPFIEVLLGSYVNTLDVKVKCSSLSDNTSDNIQECRINNVPLQTWVNISFSINGRVLDLYMDGKLVRTCILSSNPIVVPGDSDLIITPEGGFSGFTTNIQYYDDSKNPTEIYKIYKVGHKGSGFFKNMFGRYRLSVSIIDGNADNNV